MKEVVIYIFKIFINIVYSFFKLFPTNKNKVIFLSRQRNTPSINFNFLIKAIKEKDEKIVIVTSCKRLEKTPRGLIGYFFHLFYEMWHLATSKVAILETYSITVSNLRHKKSLKVIQMWHAMGSLKKFGYSILDQEEGSSSKMAKLMNMHKNYDYVMTSSKACVPYFMEAFHAERNKMFIDGLPVVDEMVSKDYQKRVVEGLKEEYPILKKKKTILYCPTFRKTKSTSRYIKQLIDCVDFKKYNLVIKLHPNSKVKIKDERVLVENKHTTIKFAFLADYIITDYSAIVFELSLLNKPIFFYTYDYDKYINTRNFYINFKDEMPGLITKDPKEIIKAIKKEDFDVSQVKKFRKKYIEIPKEGCTEKLVNLIFSLLEQK